MLTPEQIKNQLEIFLNDKNLFIVDIHISPNNNIEVIIDGDNYVSIEDCTEVSRYIESFLNRDIEDFSLIVSSPDANKPLKLPRQYLKHVGKNILVQTTDNKEIKGRIIAADHREISILTQKKDKSDKKKKIIEEEIKLPYTSIKKGKILLPF